MPLIAQAWFQVPQVHTALNRNQNVKQDNKKQMKVVSHQKIRSKAGHVSSAKNMQYGVKTVVSHVRVPGKLTSHKEKLLN